MICKNCSHENAPDEKICVNCGVPLDEEDQVQETTLAAEETADVTDLTQDTDAEEITEEISDITDEASLEIADIPDDYTVSSDDFADEFAEEKTQEEPTAKKRSGLVAFSGLIALVLIAIGLWVLFTGIFAPKYSIPLDRSKLAISYIKDNKLFQKPVSGAAVQVSENLSANTNNSYSNYSSTVVQSKDGKTVYFLENFDQTTFSGSLYVSYDGKNKTKIADNVLQGFAVSENGRTVVYMTEVDINTATGQLYYYTKGIEPQIVANSSLYQTYMVSKNGKKVAFLENVNSESGEGELYVVQTGKQPELLDEGVIASFKVSDNGEVLYAKNFNMATYTCGLYRASAGKTPEMIADGVAENYVMASEFSNKCAYVTVDEAQVYNFYKKAGNGEPVPVMENLMGFFAIDVENENFLLAKMPDDETATNPDMYLKKGNREMSYIADNMANPSHASASYDFKTIYYLNEYSQSDGTGVLHVRKEGWFGIVNDEIIAENVSAFKATKDGKTIIYITNTDEQTGLGTLNAYSNGKSKKLAEGVMSSLCHLSENGKSVIYLSDMDESSYMGNLYCVKTSGSGTAQQIDTGVYSVFYTRNDKNAIYLKNFNTETSTADLYLWKGKGEAELVDTGVATVLFE